MIISINQKMILKGQDNPYLSKRSFISKRFYFKKGELEGQWHTTSARLKNCIHKFGMKNTSHLLLPTSTYNLTNYTLHRYLKYNGYMYVKVICESQPLIFKKFSRYLEYSDISKFLNSPIQFEIHVTRFDYMSFFFTYLFGENYGLTAQYQNTCID